MILCFSKNKNKILMKGIFDIVDDGFMPIYRKLDEGIYNRKDGLFFKIKKKKN